MSKRRRTSSIASRCIEEDFEESIDSIATTSSGGPGRKRKKLDPVRTKFFIYSIHIHLNYFKDNNHTYHIFLNEFPLFL